jgi:hypothetical protein
MDLATSLLQGFATFLGGAAATVLFLMPGYVMGKAYSGGVRGPATSERVFIATTASGGLLCHLLVFWWTLPLFISLTETLPTVSLRQYVEVLAWAVVVLALLPALIGVAAARVAEVESGAVYSLMDFLGFTAAKRTAEAWNWAFRQMARSRNEVWMRVRLKDKRGVYYGLFGSRALASSDASVRDLYLQRTWPVDSHGTPLPESQNLPNDGVWIAGDQIMSVEFVSRPSTKREGTEGERGPRAATD